MTLRALPERWTSRFPGALLQGAAEEPPATTGLVLHLNAADRGSLALDGNGLVSTWRNLAPGSDPVSVGQTTAANRPSWVANAARGRGVVRFDAATPTWLEAATPFLTTPPATIYAVCSSTDTASSQFVLLAQHSTVAARALGIRLGNVADPPGPLDPAEGYVAEGATRFARTTSTWNGGALHVVSATFDGADAGTITARLDGGSAGTDTWTAFLTGIDQTHVGMRRGSSPANALTGDVAHLLVYDASHGATLRAAIENWLADLWGTP